MKFAVVSDIHGNAKTFSAILKDATKEGVDGFILVGDYCISNPYPNECIQMMKELPNLYAVVGNEEKYLENLENKDQSKWTDGQMQVSYWTYKTLSDENRLYVLSLPKEIHTALNGVKLHIAHSSDCFIEDVEQKTWSSSKLKEKYGNRFITKQNLNEEIKEYCLTDEKFNKIINSLDDGIYIFGHTHIQWSYQNKNKSITLINAGSCGIPLDCVKDGVPYTILDISDNGKVSVFEKRVDFNDSEYVKELYNSEQYKYAKVWTEIILEEFTNRRESIYFFLKFTEEYAKSIADDVRPYCISTWEQSYKLWASKEKKKT